tara:strand:- start:574 stop:936 length:363 start_codon:yes stop_codon:yes gene_type:complete
MSDPVVVVASPDQEGQLQDYSVDQVAGAFVLCLGAIASLLLVVWKSKCHCKCNLCYIFQCERRPPSEDEMQGLKDQFKATQKKDKKDKKDKDNKDKKDKDKKDIESQEPEPEPEIELPEP